MELFEAKQTLINQIDQLATDLKAKVNAVETVESLGTGNASKVADEFLATVTGGIMDMGIEYTPYTGGDIPEGKTNSWVHDQNALIMQQNCAQMAHNTRMFFESKFSKMDNYYENRYWPVDKGK